MQCQHLARRVMSVVWEQLPPFPWSAALAGAGTGKPAPSISPLCHAQLHELNWTARNFRAPESELSLPEAANPRPVPAACRLQRITKEKAASLLRGKRVRVSGDSQSRLFFLALLEFVLRDDPEDGRALKRLGRHSDFTHVWRQQQVEFHFDWAPYARNLSDAVAEAAETEIYPNVLVLGAGLWHMLHVTDAADYEESLLQLRQVVAQALLLQGRRAARQHAPRIFWLNIPTLIPRLLNTEEKRARMTEDMCLLYDASLGRSRMLQPQGPAMLVDLRRLTLGCGPYCTEDGMHYSAATYHAAVQIVLNALSIPLRKG